MFKFLADENVAPKVVEALIEKLGISKASEFWTSLGYGDKDYIRLRKELFSKETVESLYKKIKKVEKE